MPGFGENKPPKVDTEVGKKNPNSIAELISFGEGIKTTSDKVYRSVKGVDAITDLFASGVVRNKAAASGSTSARWADRVFWSRGKEGKAHVIQPDCYVIVTSYLAAQERQVTVEDVTAIYMRNADGSIVDVLPLLKGNSI